LEALLFCWVEDPPIYSLKDPSEEDVEDLKVRMEFGHRIDCIEDPKQLNMEGLRLRMRLNL